MEAMCSGKRSLSLSLSLSLFKIMVGMDPNIVLAAIFRRHFYFFLLSAHITSSISNVCLQEVVGMAKNNENAKYRLQIFNFIS